MAARLNRTIAATTAADGKAATCHVRVRRVRAECPEDRRDDQGEYGEEEVWVIVAPTLFLDWLMPGSPLDFGPMLMSCGNSDRTAVGGPTSITILPE